jgi:hypothetical protein
MTPRYMHAGVASCIVPMLLLHGFVSSVSTKTRGFLFVAVRTGALPGVK